MQKAIDKNGSYDGLVPNNSKAAKSHYNLGKLLEKKGEIDEAIASYQKAIARDPSSIEIYHNLADLFRKKGSYQDALKVYQQALQFNPETLDLYHKAAEIFMEKGDLDKAIAIYEKSIEIEPDVSWSYNNLGDALAKQEKWEKAIDAYRKAIELKPDFFWSYHNLAEALFKLEKWQESIAAYREAIRLNPDVVSSYENLAAALIKKEKWEEAAESYRRAIALKPDAFWFQKNLGDALLKQEKWEEAMVAYSRVIELKPDLIWSYENLGFAQLKAKKWAEAEATYQQAIAQNPEVSWYHKNLGNALFKQDQNDKAISAYRRAIQIDPGHDESYHKLGEALAKKGDIGEAIFCYKKAIQLNPNSLWVHVKLADALARLGQWQEAIASYKKAIDIEPDLHVAIYNRLADALQGDKTTAKAIEAEITVAPSLKETAEKWPYIAPKNRPWPKTLPDGSPWPKISIVTPSYDRGKFIEETILSIVNQDYPNVEHILIDGGSTDETMTVVDRYREHFSYVVSEPDSGQSNALNKGLSRATGEILTWVNSDDRLAPGALYAIALAFHTSKADIVAGVCQVFEEDEEILQHVTSAPDGLLALDDILDVENCWLSGKFFHQPEVMFSRAIWEKIGGALDESLYYSMDYQMWAQFAACGARIQAIGTPTAQFRMHPEQKTSATEKYQPELLKTRDALRVKYNRPTPKLPESDRPKRHALRVVFLNDLGFEGGAGIAHKEIARALGLAGHEIIPIAGRSRWSFEAADFSAAEAYELVASVKPDLVVVGNLHNIKNDIELLEMLAAKFPTIFVMHDQWLLTGRCAYIGSCEKYTTQCDADCPTSNSYPSLLPGKIADVFTRKRELVKNSENLLVLGNSNWTTNWARFALLNTPFPEVYQLLEKRFQPLRLGLDLEIFQPGDKKNCRRMLGLPEDKFIVLTGSTSMQDTRKGASHLIEALEIANLENAMLVGFGNTQKVESKIEVFTTGYLDDRSILALYYSAADLFVGPSLEESFGQTFVEAAACGTPAVGYAIGGVKEAIADGVTGRLVSGKNPEALAKVISELYYDRQQLELLSISAPIHVRNTYSYRSIYQSFMVALERSGWQEKLGLDPISKFALEAPKICRPIFISASPEDAQKENGIGYGVDVKCAVVSGFSNVEASQPQIGIFSPSRWALWPKSRIAIISDEEKAGQILISFRNISADQFVELWNEDGEMLWRSPVLNASIHHPNVVTLPVSLKPGYNFFDLKTDKYTVDASQRALAVLADKIAFYPDVVSESQKNNFDRGKTILMDEHLVGSGWFPAEMFEGKYVRWMEKTGIVIAEAPLADSVKVEIAVKAAMDSSFVEGMVVKINNALLDGKIELQQDNSWIFTAVASADKIVAGQTCIIAINTPGVKELRPNDSRAASLLVTGIKLKPLDDENVFEGKTIYMDSNVLGSGWFPAEKVGEKSVRWMGKNGIIVTEVPAGENLKVKISGLASLKPDLLTGTVVKINNRSLAGNVAPQSDNSWMFEAAIPEDLLVAGRPCILSIESPEVKQLGPQDSRSASLLVERVEILPLAPEKTFDGKTILMDANLQGEGWFSAEFYREKFVRWMKETGTIVTEIPVVKPLQIKVEGLLATNKDFVEGMAVKIGDAAVENGTIKRESDRSWTFNGVIPAGAIDPDKPCVISIESPGVKELSPKDSRTASLLVTRVILKAVE
ncbi:MAG: tetratricopeptide repeat protein [Cyanobacteriota bacterium]|nr:tetratricopeptide repeat protein [Cyanobacteriota bacterium]